MDANGSGLRPSAPTVVRPGQLHSAARLSTALVYTVGVAGVIAGGVLWREGNVPFALVAWALTFVAGAALQLVAWLTRGVAQILQRIEQLGEEIRLMRGDRLTSEGLADPDDPYGRRGWSQWH